MPTNQRAADDRVAPPTPPTRAHLRRTGRLHVAAPVGPAFELFTPLGEKLWVAGWSPEFHHPPGGEPVAGAVFTTAGADGLTTDWVLVDWQPERYRVRYARITPGRRAGTVEVCCEVAGASSTVVRVTYELTALGDAGDADLATWTEAWYAEYLAGWERDIAQRLSIG